YIVAAGRAGCAGEGRAMTRRRRDFRLHAGRAGLACAGALLLASCSSPAPGDPDAATPDARETFEPGMYLSPMVQLQRLQGVSDHLHVDEVRLRDDGLLLQCSYTFGVVDATD